MFDPVRSLPPTRRRAPWYYRLAKWLGRRRGIRGSGILVRAAHRCGLLNCIVRYPVAGQFFIDIPLYRQANQWDAQQIASYERAFLDLLASEIERLGSPAMFVDCGAEIGLFSVALRARTAKINSIFAFEPDPAVYELLTRNLARLPLQTSTFPLAVGRGSGRGELVLPPGTASEQARHVVVGESGSVEITSLDEVLPKTNANENLVLKIDVEGFELDVLLGAEQLLRSAPVFVVAFEAHPDVVARTGVDPIECLRFLAGLRPCRFLLAEAPEIQLTVERPFFDQVPGGQILNVIAVSHE